MSGGPDICKNNYMSTILSSSSINGTSVKNASGDDLGNIKDLMIDTGNGKITYAVLSFGGFLGLGDKYFAIPWSSLSVNTQDETMILDISQERLKDAPGFDKDNWPDQASDYYSSVNTFYTVREKAYTH